jgi:NAD(P)-dependent dehydrogenase (short-subunit alcohol dehydrogenase family)
MRKMQMQELRYDRRVAVITGGGRGLGRSYGLLLASRGAKIVVNDNGASMKGDATEESPAADVVAEIRALGGEAIVSTDSVATPEGGAAIIRSAIEAFGRVDILIHSAGNVRRAPLRTMSYEDFELVLSVHLRGAFHVVREAFPIMCDAGYGRIVLTSSINGLYGKSDNVNYSVSKAGMMGLSQTAGIEGRAFGVTSNLIVPAAVTRMSDGIDTSQFPPLEPEMVAPVVAWLAHDSCTVTGEIYAAMGGRVARAWIAESPGVMRRSWTPEQIAADVDAIRSTDDPVIFAPVPDGQLDHLMYGFDMARQQAV